ncbi:MAG: hypothetical protein KDC71_08760 [Acidobacteria bacterium]|nr:hypothetical protein [Acidobacteriota bacterium]
MAVSRETILAGLKASTDDELLQRFEQGGMTPLAHEVLLEEMANRGLKAPEWVEEEEPEPAEPEAIVPSEWRTLIELSEQSEAFMLVHRLEQEGFEAMAEPVIAEETAEDGSLQIRVQVKTEQFESCQAFFEQLHLSEWSEKLHCPKCQSDDVEVVHVGIMDSLKALMRFRPDPDNRRCRACKHSWKE